MNNNQSPLNDIAMTSTSVHVHGVAHATLRRMSNGRKSNLARYTATMRYLLDGFPVQPWSHPDAVSNYYAEVHNVID